MKLQPTNKRTGYRGLTLVELAVTVVVTSGSMVLLLPSFQDGREKARLAACQSNLGQIARAFLSYTSERSAIPMFSDGSFWAPWTYGGWSGSNREYWEASWPMGNIQTRDRPLSVYMTPWEIPDEKDWLTPTEEAPLFHCPSDNNSAQWQWGEFTVDACQEYSLPAYQDVGTSYQMNFHWWEQIDDISSDWNLLLGYYATQIFRKYIEQDSSRYVILLEDPLDMGFGYGGLGNAGIQVQGFHGEFAKHVVGFADAHVEYLYVDSRHDHDSFPMPPGPRHGSRVNCGSWSVCDWQLEHFSGGRHDSSEECPE